MPQARQALVVLLRLVGCFDLLALGGVVMPQAWMEATHAWLQMGSLPDAPVVGYLARSTSMLYAVHAAMLLFISFDVVRYWRLITFVAISTIVLGITVLAIDLAEGMPLFWTLLEGPSLVLVGALLLALQGRPAGAPPASQLRTARAPS
jgi:hypothetical protein